MQPTAQISTAGADNWINSGDCGASSAASLSKDHPAAACAGVSSFPERQTLCLMTSALDEEVGRFVADLKARGLWENTLLWVVTDNGGMTDFRGDFSFPASGSSNWPLRGGKTTLFEGGVRGVSFVGGGYLPAAARGTESHELMHAADIPATLAALGGRAAESFR